MVNLTPFFQALLALATAIMTAFVIPWIQSKLSAEKQAKLVQWINIAVEAAEQILAGPGRGEEKRAYVVAFLAEKGYILDMDKVSTEIDALIESAVYQLNGY